MKAEPVVEYDRRTVRTKVRTTNRTPNCAIALNNQYHTYYENTATTFLAAYS